MNVATNGTKLNVDGYDFKIVDLRDHPNHYQDDGSYYGSKRATMITADGLGDREDYSEAIKCTDGDKFWIDGKLYYLIVKNLHACEGVAFITSETFNAVKQTIENMKEVA